MAITTSMLAKYKRDLLCGVHHHGQSRSFTNTSTTTTTITGISPAISESAPIVVGEQVSGTNWNANTVVSRILSSTSIQTNIPPSAAVTAFSVVGDTFNMVLIKSGMAGTYGASNTGYADITGNSDETSGTGYTAGGLAMTNVDPVASSPSAYTSFSPNPSWTSASFSTAGCMIVNKTQNGPIANPASSVHDFGGTQTVAGGTFTVIMPVPGVGTAVLQIT
jgi:hypothetical protein